MRYRKASRQEVILSQRADREDVMDSMQEQHVQRHWGGENTWLKLRSVQCAGKGSETAGREQPSHAPGLVSVLLRCILRVWGSQEPGPDASRELP